MNSTFDQPQEMQTCNRDIVQPSTSRSFDISNFQFKDIEKIKAKASMLGLDSEIRKESILIKGSQGMVLDFLDWLYDLLNTSLNMRKEKEDFSQDEVSINTFHRIYRDEILLKAQELSIVCEMRYNMLSIVGSTQDLKEFKCYLQEVETAVKRDLYPKYWNLEDQEIYSEVEVLPGCQEFQEVKARMIKTLSTTKIVKLTRIQNNYLMAHYLTNVNKRREITDFTDDRQLLFHGTSVEPSTISQNFDTGFDLQFASQSGRYGKGIYFAKNASYSHGYAFKARNGNMQMFLADVFVGKPYTAEGNNTLIKAPSGYDSVYFK